MLARHESAPGTWQAPLRAELAEAGADSDPDLVTAARSLMRLIDSVGTQAGKYTVDMRGVQGVQIGDHNKQDNVFNAPRAAGPEMTAAEHRRRLRAEVPDGHNIHGRFVGPAPRDDRHLGAAESTC